MTTAYTSLLGLALPVTGELSGTWGDTVNNSITSLVDSAIAGTTTLSADTTLTTTTGASNQARQAILLCTGHSANITITAPAQSKIYTVINASATYTVKIRGATPTTGITIPVSSTATVAWNGSDFVDATNYINGNIILGSGTANGVAYLNATKQITTGTALVFDGTNLGIGNTTPASYNSSADNLVIGTSGSNGITIVSGSTSSGYIMFADGTTGQQAYEGQITYDHTNNFMAFNTSGAQKMRIATSAYPIVTVTSTGYDVAGIGTDYATVGAFGSAGGGFKIQRGSGAGIPIATLYADGGTGTNLFAVEADQPLNLGVGSATKMTIGALTGGVGAVGIGYTSLTSVGNNGLAVLGNVAIGTSSPSYKLDVQNNGNSSTTIAVQNSTSGTSGSTRFLAISSAGNASFGMTSPGYTDITNAADALLINTGSASGGMVFAQDGVGKMWLDSSGNLGLGVTPSAWVSSWKAFQIGAAGSQAGSIYTNAGGTTGQIGVAQNWYWNGTNNLYLTSAAASDYYQYAGTHVWRNAPSGTAGNVVTLTQAMTLDASGKLLVGTTAAQLDGSSKMVVLNSSATVAEFTASSGTATQAVLRSWNTATTGDNLFQTFHIDAGATQKGSIYYNRTGGLLVYLTTSDYRAKDIIGPVTDSGSVIDSVPVYMGKMKDATQERPMFIAHETPAYAHVGKKDAVDADGNPVYQQMDASALVPVMWAEIQSLRKRLAAAGI